MDRAKSGKRTAPAIAALAVLAVAALSGCREPSANSSEAGAAASSEAGQLLKEVFAAYAAAETYSDQAEIVFRHSTDGTPVEDSTTVAIDFERPDHLRVEVLFEDAEVYLADNGEQVQARIESEKAHNFDNQFVRRSSPEELTCGSVYEASVLVPALPQPDAPPLSALEGPYVRLELLPLGLLLGDSQFPAIVAEASKAEELAPRKIGESTCRRIRITAPEGEFTFWIDETRPVLRRIEYPTGTLVASDAAGHVRDAVLRVELSDVKLNEPIPASTFELEVPADAKIVRHFVQPPLEEPAAGLGETIEPFELTDLDGGAKASSDWQDKTLVLFFFDNHPDSAYTAGWIEAAQRRLKDDASVAIVGVCTEPLEDAIGELPEPSEGVDPPTIKGFSNTELRNLINGWGVSFPVYRDLAAVGLEKMHVTEAPTTVVLDGGHRVHYVQTGSPVNFGEELLAVIEELKEGEDLAQKQLDMYNRFVQGYQETLAAAAEGSSEELIELPDVAAAVPARDEPQRLELAELWSLELESPGNILVVPGEGEADDKVYVLDGWRTVVQLSAAGEAIERVELGLPEEAGIAFLRAGVDGSSQTYIAGGAKLARQAFLFDDQWNLVLSYPAADVEHPGIQDVMPADLDGPDDGPLQLYVGFWGTAGVHAVDLDGTRNWVNRSVHPVLSLSPSAPNTFGWQNLLTTSDTGSIVPINRFGNAEEATLPSGGGVHLLYAPREWPAEGAAMCGITYGPASSLLMQGLTADLRELYRYALPSGAYSTELRTVTSGMLLADMPLQWLLAGPDGSLHLVSSDGNFHDHFHYGARISGIGIANLAGQPVMLVAAGGKVTAWQVSRKSAGP